MEPLQPPECHYLSCAAGWVELGNTEEAEKELGSLGPAWQQHPDVLEVRWMIRARQERWEDALQIARSLLHAAPERVSGWIHQAYALRRAPRGGLAAAWDVLRPATGRFPQEPIVAYNLSCYACQMQRLDESRSWLKRAMALGGKEEIRKQALADEDLKPLWSEIRML